MADPEIDIGSLSVDERLQLVEKLWESLTATPDTIPFTAAQRAELNRRLDDLERDGGVGIPWEEVVSRIRERYR